MNEIYRDLGMSEDKIDAEVNTLTEWMRKQPHLPDPTGKSTRRHCSYPRHDFVRSNRPVSGKNGKQTRFEIRNRSNPVCVENDLLYHPRDQSMRSRVLEHDSRVLRSRTGFSKIINRVFTIRLVFVRTRQCSRNTFVNKICRNSKDYRLKC